MDVDPYKLTIKLKIELEIFFHDSIVSVFLQ